MASVDIWAIVGISRWARVMAAELCAALPRKTPIYLLGNSSDIGLQEWLSSSGLVEKIEVVTVLPECSSSKVGVAFVVNSAYLHKKTIESLLAIGYNVVCEKPMSFSREETLNLVNVARELGLQLFSTNTYLFASYLDSFKKGWLASHKYTSIHISWLDPINENRHGEVKGYDSGTPLIYDVLPHVASIALATIGDFSTLPRDVKVLGGGSQVLINYWDDGLDINVHLERNARERKRTLRLSGPGRKVLLDFSIEPGLVSVNQLAPIPVDPLWSDKPRPILAMLNSVQEFFETGKFDQRLSPSASLLGNDLIDGVVDSYISQQIDFLLTYCMSGCATNLSDCNYACKEVRSILSRVLPHLPEVSPLRTLALAVSALNTQIK